MGQKLLKVAGCCIRDNLGQSGPCSCASRPESIRWHICELFPWLPGGHLLEKWIKSRSIEEADAQRIDEGEKDTFAWKKDNNLLFIKKNIGNCNSKSG
jgi:hypothetical protein